MKREAVIVGIFGLGLGLLVAWGIWNFKSKPKPAAPQLAPTIAPTTVPSFFLDLTSPEDESVLTETEATVSGKTIAKTTVVISTNTDDKVLETQSDGSFTTTVDLEEGENIIAVTVYSPTQETKEEVRTVIYEKEAL